MDKKKKSPESKLHIIKVLEKVSEYQERRLVMLQKEARVLGAADRLRKLD